MRARVYVTLKREVLDPQGEAVRRALGSMGIEGLKDVRIGKMIELEVDGDAETVKSKIEQAAKSLLANPVMEDFKIETIE